jgi:predicted nuclease of predicted toxin-antitoxin system
VKLKLDENLGSIRVVSMLRLAGHDVATVREQNLSSTLDELLIDICRREDRCLVTLDRGFGNRLRYNPSDYSGIVLLRMPSQSKPQDLQLAVEILIRGLDAAEVAGKLWIIRGEQLLEYQAISEDESD